jgi:hypothetical protein
MYNTYNGLFTHQLSGQNSVTLCQSLDLQFLELCFGGMCIGDLFNKFVFFKLSSLFFKC